MGRRRRGRRGRKWGGKVVKNNQTKGYSGEECKKI